MEKSFITGFIVLGFVIFIAGFLAGMLAVALVKIDFTAAGFMIFSLGFIIGLLTIVMALITLKFTKMENKVKSKVNRDFRSLHFPFSGFLWKFLESKALFCHLLSLSPHWDTAAEAVS